ERLGSRKARTTLSFHHDPPRSERGAKLILPHGAARRRVMGSGLAGGRAVVRGPLGETGAIGIARGDPLIPLHIKHDPLVKFPVLDHQRLDPPRLLVALSADRRGRALVWRPDVGVEDVE